MSSTSAIGRLPATSLARLDDLRRAYETSHDEYISTTPTTVEGDMKRWMDSTVENLPTSASILELGSGSGRDAQYFESRGYTVLRSDVAVAFVERLNQLGHTAVVLDAVRDPLPTNLDLIFANAVFCHFEKKQFRRFLERCKLALKVGGTLSFSMKAGVTYKSCERQDRIGVERQFSEWPKQELDDFLLASGFTVKSSEVTSAIRSSSEWINVIAINDRQPTLF